MMNGTICIGIASAPDVHKSILVGAVDYTFCHSIKKMIKKMDINDDSDDDDNNNHNGHCSGGILGVKGKVCQRVICCVEA